MNRWDQFLLFNRLNRLIPEYRHRRHHRWLLLNRLGLYLLLNRLSLWDRHLHRFLLIRWHLLGLYLRLLR